MTVYKLQNVTEAADPPYRLHTDTSTTPYGLSTSTESGPEDSYDAEGALKFIVATVLVYSIMGVFCTLLLRVKRKHGRTHQGFVYDEHVAKYHKYEKQVRYDSSRRTLQQECSLVAERVRQYEQKLKLQDLEKEITSPDFASPSNSTGNKVNNKKDRPEVSDTVGKMGLALFYMGDDMRRLDSPQDSVQLSEEARGKETGPGIDACTVELYSDARDTSVLIEPINSIDDNTVRVHVTDV